MKIFILGSLVITILTLILNILIDYFVLKKDESLLNCIKNITNDKKTLLTYLSIIIIEIIIFSLMGTDVMFYMYYFVILILYRIILIDYKTTYIDNNLLLIFIVISILSLAVNNGVPIIGRIITGIVTYLLLAIVSKVTQGSLGMGDAKLLGLLGLILGFDGLLSVMLVSSVMVFFVSIFLIIKSMANKKKELPFTPYIFAALILMLIINNI